MSFNEDLKKYHEFLSSLINDRPETTKTGLYHLFYERFPHVRLSFGELLSIDHHLFGFNYNAWWRYLHRLPKNDDPIKVLGRTGRATHVGVFTLSIEFDDE